jgi:hypothetical protein
MYILFVCITLQYGCAPNSMEFTEKEACIAAQADILKASEYVRHYDKQTYNRVMFSTCIKKT